MEQKITVSKEVCDSLWNLKIRNVYLVREDGSDKLVAVAKLSRITRQSICGTMTFTDKEDAVTVDVFKELPVVQIIVENDAELRKINKKYKDATLLYTFNAANQKAVDEKENAEDKQSRERFIRNNQVELEQLVRKLDDVQQKIESNQKLIKMAKFRYFAEKTMNEPKEDLLKFIQDKQAEQEQLHNKKKKLEQHIELKQNLLMVVNHKSESSYPKQSLQDSLNASVVGFGVAAAAMAGLLLYKAASAVGSPEVIAESIKSMSLR